MASRVDNRGQRLIADAKAICAISPSLRTSSTIPRNGCDRSRRKTMVGVITARP